MKHPSRFVTLAALVFALAAAGCPPRQQVGALCALAVEDDGGGSLTGTTVTINPGAVECPSGICLLPAAERATTTGALCSAGCSSDEDCGDAQTTRDSGDPHCKTGFLCGVATTVGDFCCRKLCLCKDFVDLPPGGLRTPAVCQPGAGGACPNIR